MKLWVHQKSFSGEELLVNPKEFKDIKEGDILEIYHEDVQHSHLLLQVKTLKSVELPQKDIISIDQGIANLFQLRAYKDVAVKPVNISDVALDLVELVFKDQYISRSDMWKLGKSQIGKCLYVQKKIVHASIRAQVLELWSRGQRVSCGAVTEETRVAFRSSTGMVYMFIQMSAEMWEFDTCGELYMEKAVDGFLTELFNSWKEKKINSELTIVLFSRSHYEAVSIDEFPESMRTSLHMDCKGRIYQDFYRVVVLNERRDEWLPVLITIKQLMMEYKQNIEGSRHQECLPKGQNSKSAEGNVLEAINLSLNVFDNHYVNRNFDRTGQVILVVTPGAGVFEADKILVDMTRLRMIDYGIGSDLVCLAEQPPHPVPLLIYSNVPKDTKASDDNQKYNIPNWLNYSFYLSRSQRHRQFSSTQVLFKPRCRLPNQKDLGPSSPTRRVSFPRIDKEQHDGQNDDNKDEDDESRYEQYDSQVFTCCGGQPYQESINNPFKPSTLITKLTADRKRWTHTFPRGPGGETTQLHHKISYYMYGQEGNGIYSNYAGTMSTSSSDSSLCTTDYGDESYHVEDTPNRSHRTHNDLKSRVACTWGITGEQSWTPNVQSGVDWKSLTTSACFPITTDYYPERCVLEADYEEAPYNLDAFSFIEDIKDEDSKVKETLINVVQELVSQRLIQDFQLVVIPQTKLNSLAQQGRRQLPLVTDKSKMEYVLSYGNTFHKISLKLDRYNIEVVKYNAKNEIPTSRLAYTYQLWGVKKNRYDIARTRVYHKPVQNDKWNLRDNHICFGKDADKEGFELNETLKFWRSRFVLLPSAASLIKKLSEPNNQSEEIHFDVFEERTAAQNIQLIEGFLKFVEGLNRRRRTPQTLSAKQPIQRVPSDNSTTSTNHTPMRRISRTSGSTTPTTFQPVIMLTANAITAALSTTFSRQEIGSLPSSPVSPEMEGLGLLSPRTNIIAGMRDSSTGLTFLNSDYRGQPPDCFVSCDAVSWIQKTLTTTSTPITHNQAMAIMQDLLDDGLIHSLAIDGPGTRRFLFGYYLYCLVQDAKNKGANSPAAQTAKEIPEIKPLYGMQETTNSWFEVECHHPDAEDEGNNNKQTTTDNASEDSSDVGVRNGTEQKMSSPPKIVIDHEPRVYKSRVMEIDSNKSDHLERCHVGYHSKYHPGKAFEIELQWLTSTPSLLVDIITNWARRATSCGFHLVPYLIDPFGFCKDISDPFRSPIFISLNIPDDLQAHCYDNGLMTGGIQQMVLKRFGFLLSHTTSQSPLLSNTSLSRGSLSIHDQYIHVSGMAFIFITPIEKASPVHSVTPRDNLPCTCYCSNPRQPEIHQAREEIPCDTPSKCNNLETPGFLWIPNHLLTKKWRSSATGDEKLHDALLADFTNFCEREDGRLEEALNCVDKKADNT